MYCDTHGNGNTDPACNHADAVADKDILKELIFTIRENGKRIWLKRVLLVCEALDMTPVPIEEVGTDLSSRYPMVEALLERADGNYPNGGKKEGIVVRPTEPVFCPLISASLSMKIVSNKYLLKNEG